MTTVSIHQPMYLPYPGILNKIKSSDIFVFLDDAQYTRTYFYNRNKIKSPNGELMMTVPIVKKHQQNLNDVRISDTTDWQQHHYESLKKMYSKSEHFKDYKDYFEEIYSKKWILLNDLNIETMCYLMRELDLDMPIYFSSKLLQNSEFRRTERLIALCKKVGADTYLSGVGGMDYIEERLFEKGGIELRYQDYKPREYNQRFPPFIPNLSVVDLLFNNGEKSKEYV